MRRASLYTALMMKKLKMKSIMAILFIAPLIFVGGILIVARKIQIDDSIIVDSSVKDTFSFVTELSNVNKTTDNLADIEQITEDLLSEGSQYKRVLLIHGNSNKQVVSVMAYEENAKFVTNTELFGFDVTYTYHFHSLNETTTQVDLIKEAHIQGVWQLFNPLLKHLLTRPEHDGRHLLLLKEAVES